MIEHPSTVPSMYAEHIVRQAWSIISSPTVQQALHEGALLASFSTQAGRRPFQLLNDNPNEKVHKTHLFSAVLVRHLIVGT